MALASSQCPNLAMSRPRALTGAELGRLLDVTSNNLALQDLHDLATIVWYTGVRPGEAAQVRWSDIDFDRCRIVFLGKSGRTRFACFGRQTLAVLRARREREPKAERLLGPSPQRLLRLVSSQLRRVCDDNDLHGVTFRTLRHTMFCRLMDSGASVASLISIGGWSDSSLVNSHGFPTGENLIEIAARDQAKIEDTREL